MTTKTLKLVIIDDHEDNANANAAKIRKSLKLAGMAADVYPMSLEDKQKVINRIEQIDDVWELNAENPPVFEMLNGVDIVFIDYQLGALKEHSWLTAEDMAGWFRAFSEVPLIVILNRFYDVDFDLTMGQGAIPTAADFHMNADSLACVGLWKDVPWQPNAPLVNFRPWSWPRLHEAVQDIVACRKELSADENFLQSSILSYFHFTDDLADQMTHNALGFLNPNSKTPQTASFDDLLNNGRLGIAKQLQKELRKNITLPSAKKSAVNVLVSSIRRWLSAMILGPQDVLIDAPHLLQRMPWLVGENLNNPEFWNRTIVDSAKNYFPEAVLRFSYPKKTWLSRETFVMPLLQSDPDILKIYADGQYPQQVDLVFLEDFSVFTGPEDAESFTAGFNSIWSTRYVSRVAVEEGEIHYAPKVRLV